MADTHTQTHSKAAAVGISRCGSSRREPAGRWRVETETRSPARPGPPRGWLPAVPRRQLFAEKVSCCRGDAAAAAPTSSGLWGSLFLIWLLIIDFFFVNIRIIYFYSLHFLASLACQQVGESGLCSPAPLCQGPGDVFLRSSAC